MVEAVPTPAVAEAVAAVEAVPTPAVAEAVAAVAAEAAAAAAEAAAAASEFGGAAAAVVAAEAEAVGYGPSLAGFGLANQSASESKNIQHTREVRSLHLCRRAMDLSHALRTWDGPSLTRPVCCRGRVIGG